MEEIFKTLPQHTCSWSNDMPTMYKYQGFWNTQKFHELGILAQQNFKAQPSDVLLCSYMKTGTTWLKALAFAIITRSKFDESTSPLLTALPHECIPFLEKDLEKIQENQKNSSFPLVATHLPYTWLPESVATSNCKIVYIYRNIKDVIVSYYHFMKDILKVDVPFNEVYEEFFEGISTYGPYWDHALGYWKARQERPGRILFLKYEDMKRDDTTEVKKLAEFIGYPFTSQEEKSGVIGYIIKLCSFDHLRNLPVNKTGKYYADEFKGVENRLFFRKAKDGDWENYFTDEMKEKIDKLVDEKLSGTGLVMK